MQGIVRKDCSPLDTVNKIETILKKNNIKTKVVSKIIDTYFCSSRVEFLQLPGIGTNGKGINNQYSMASAYGEFMERLQNDCLINSNFWYKNYKNMTLENTNCCDNDDLFKLLNNLFSIDDLQKNDLVKFVNQFPVYKTLKKYYSVFEQKFVNLPQSFINIATGSNGLCAGNTSEEAISQGICEIFERIALKKIYYNDIVTIPTFDVSVYSDFSSYQALKFIEEKGYICYVKDLTFNGRIPVVGLLVIDKSRKKYNFTLGSDINFDIALQRCITEMFQGRTFDFSFSINMNHIFNKEMIAPNMYSLKNEFRYQEFVKSIVSGKGNLPLSAFSSKPSLNNKLKPFENQSLSNQEAKNYLFNILQKNNMHLYIQNNSYLGFPAFRVFIPKYTEIQPNFPSLLADIRARYKFARLLNNNTLKSKEEITQLAEVLHTLNTASRSNTSSIGSILGLLFSDQFELFNINTLQLEVILHIKLKNYKTALSLYQSYANLGVDFNDYVYLYIFSLANNINPNQLFDIFYDLDNKEGVATLNKFKSIVDSLIFPSCPDCAECFYRKSCKFNDWNIIHKNVANKMKAFCTSLEDYVKLV